jgi:hypothetical protein
MLKGLRFSRRSPYLWWFAQGHGLGSPYAPYPADPTETSILMFQSTRGHIPEDTCFAVSHPAPAGSVSRGLVPNIHPIDDARIDLSFTTQK